MAIEHDLATYLAAQASITALVSTRIYDHHIPQNGLRPAITYAVNGGIGFRHTVGLSGLARTNIQLVFHGNDDGTGVLPRQIYDAVRVKVDAFGGTWGSSTIRGTELSRPTNVTGTPLIGTENGYPALAATLEVFHTESTS